MAVDRSFGVILFRLVKGVPVFLLVLLKWETERGRNNRSFPKGHPKEKDISDKHTAVRELWEETGILITVEDLFPGDPIPHRYSFPHEGATIEKEVLYFIAFIEGDPEIRLQADEVTAAEWMTCDRALKAVAHPELQEVVLKAHRLVMA